MVVLDLQTRRTPGKAPDGAPDLPALATPPARRRPRRRGLWAIGGLALAAAAGGGWWALKPLPVTTAAVTTGTAVEAVYASGVVEYVRQARVAPVVTAPIRQVFVAEGQDVKAGQALAQLDDGPQLGTALQLAAQAALARTQAARQARLFEAGFGARAAFEDAQQQQAAAEAAAASARARLGDYRIKAPFAGRVLRRDAEPGDLAAAAQPMFVVADPRALRITADIDERDVGRLAVGQTAMVRADGFPGRTFEARVSEITPQGDAQGRVFRARLSLPADTALRPGMTVEANLVTARRDGAVLVPTAAVKDGAVWVADGGRAHRRAVRTGAQGADRTEALAGLSPGETVITPAPARLAEGARIAPRR